MELNVRVRWDAADLCGKPVDPQATVDVISRRKCVQILIEITGGLLITGNGQVNHHSPHTKVKVPKRTAHKAWLQL